MLKPAYKTMMFLGICDVFSTVNHSIATGIFGFYGISFCDSPRVFYILGVIGMSSWMGCCISSIVLAFIRVCDLDNLNDTKKCFEGWKIFVILGIFCVYVIYPMLFTKPIIFNLTHMSWFFDPGVGKDVSQLLCAVKL